MEPDMDAMKMIDPPLPAAIMARPQAWAATRSCR
jgi:hypothetical protein